MLYLYGLLAVLEILSIFGIEMAVVGLLIDMLGIYEVSDTRTFTIGLVSLSVFVITRIIVAALENGRRDEEVGKTRIS